MGKSKKGSSSKGGFKVDIYQRNPSTGKKTKIRSNVEIPTSARGKMMYLKPVKEKK